MVVIPHQTEILKLVAYQKALISQLSSLDYIFIQSLPLWIEYKPLEESLKDEGKAITSVKILSPDFSKETLEVFCPVLISTKNKEYSSKITLLQILPSSINSEINFHTQEKIKALLNKTGTEIKFPCPLKIFRLGKSIKPLETSKAIEDSLWIKLSN